MADVNKFHEDGTPKSPEEIEQEERAATPPVPGSKTPSELLLKSLQEEREKRKELEDRITLLEAQPSPDIFSEEGKALQRKIDEAREKIDLLTHQNAEKDVLMAHPELKDKWGEFETYRADPENKGMNLKTAAKAFLVEHGLLDSPRKGLEKTTGGGRVAPSTGMTVQEIAHLRETNFKKYQDMLEKGLIKV